MIFKITIEATEEAGYLKEVQTALNDLNIAFGDELISWTEEEIKDRNINKQYKKETK